MKRIGLFLIAALVTVTLWAQPSLNGIVTGKVIDASNGEPFMNVTVAVYSMPDSSVTTGVVTGEDGLFMIDNLPAGDYNLVATFVGYRSKSIRFILSPEVSTFDVGEIVLAESAEDIGSVNVIAVKPQIIYRDNKKILKVSEFQNAGANTLAEVLENAPSVTLDSEGNVLLRGSANYTLLVDGKPVPGTGVNMLRQIPPEMVEDVEIMTNPSAKYDPDGVTGIINLVLKKQTEAGINGQLSLMAGLKGKYNGDGQFNFRKNKVNLFAGVTATRYNTEATGDLWRETSDASDESIIDNGFSQKSNIRSLIGNAGMDYTINEKNSISLSGRFGPQDITAILDNEITREVTDPLLTGNFLFTNELNLKGFMYSPGVTWDHKFKNEGEKIQVNIFAGGFRGDLVQEMTEEVADNGWNGTGVLTDLKRLGNEMLIDDYRAKADYEKSFGEKGKLEAGYQFRGLKERNNHQLDYYDDISGEWIEDILFTNRFVLNRDLHSLYSTWGATRGKISYQAGLRVEYTDRLVKQEITGDSYTYNKLNLFPSASVTRKIKETMQLQASYSRRINRPGRFQLNPFPQYADNQLIVRGNPELDPEFVDSYELSFQDQVKIGFLSAEAYYRRVNGLMTNVITPGENGVVYQEFVNANRSHSAGTELMANVQPAAWIRIIASANLYYYILDDELIYSSNDAESFVWNGNATTVFLPAKSTRLTVTAVYNGPSINLQGSQKSSYMINLGVRQEMLKGKASLALSVRDLFATFKFENELRGENFTTVTSVRPESRVATLTFTYNLNNYRRRSQGDEMELNFIR